MVGSSLTSSQIFSSTSTNFTNPDSIIGIIESLINSSSEFSLLIKLETLRIVTSL